MVVNALRNEEVCVSAAVPIPGERSMGVSTRIGDECSNTSTTTSRDEENEGGGWWIGKK